MFHKGNISLEGEGAVLKCYIHNYSTTDPIAFHQHIFNNAHKESGARPCEMPGCGKTAHFENKPMLTRAICADCANTIKEAYN